MLSIVPCPLSQGSEYSPFLHDIVYLYILALNKTLAEEGEPRDGEVMFKTATKLGFEGKPHVMLHFVVNLASSALMIPTEGSNLSEQVHMKRYTAFIQLKHPPRFSGGNKLKVFPSLTFIDN